MLEHAARHNDLISKKFSELSELDQVNNIDQAISHYSKYDFGFDEEAFRKWLKENPSKPKKNETLGDYLHHQAEQFEKKNPSVKLQEVAGNATEDMKKIATECRGNLDCAKLKISAWMDKTLSKSCVIKTPESQRDLASMMLITNSSYFISYLTDKSPDKEFPTELLVNNLFWQPIMSEMGCRATLANGKIGQKVQFGQQSAYKHYGKNYVNYMISSPLYNISLMGIITAKDAIQGKEIKWKDLGIKFGALTVYDAGYAVNRILIVQNPLFLKQYPNLKEGIQRFNTRKLPRSLAPAASQVSYYSLDWGTRLGIGWLNTRFYQWYMKQVEKQLKTQKEDAPSSTSTSDADLKKMKTIGTPDDSLSRPGR